MLRSGLGLAALACLIAGCQPSARFIAIDCSPLLEEGELQALRFRSTIQAQFLSQQQLVYEVAVVNAANQPVQARTDRYRDSNGTLSAAKTLMVFGDDWTFDDTDVTIPAPELEATADQLPAWADVRVTTTDGATLATQRIMLPPPYSLNAQAPRRREPAAEPADEDVPPAVAARSRPVPPRGSRESGDRQPPREERVASAERGDRAPGSPPPRSSAASSGREPPASRSGAQTDRTPAARREAGRPPTETTERAAPRTAEPETRTPARPADPKESDRARPTRRGEPPPLRPVGSSGRDNRETPARPSATTQKSPESRERVMAGVKETPRTPTSAPAAAEKRPASSSQPAGERKPVASQPAGAKKPASQPASQPGSLRDSELEKGDRPGERKSRKDGD